MSHLRITLIKIIQKKINKNIITLLCKEDSMYFSLLVYNNIVLIFSTPDQLEPDSLQRSYNTLSFLKRKHNLLQFVVLNLNIIIII